ncbi:MAG: AAA family ATPase [Acidobacteriota bacterium]|nr:MAG: AAA family ATPase [Acidobacteriota bacterium]
MGVVYETYDREREQRVALKTLARIDPQAIFRLKREFRSLAEIVHPNLIALYELISDGDRWFFTMELIDGGVDFLTYLGRSTARRREKSFDTDLPSAMTAKLPDLETDTLINRPTGDEDTLYLTGDVPAAGSTAEAAQPEVTLLDEEQLERLRRIMGQLVEGVSAIHRVGKLHRDLKPGNVMVRPDGSVVILDFGLVTETPEEHLERANRSARSMMVSGTSYSTSDGFIVGTADYMSPEQAGGEPLTEASDWYSVGVMLYAALTGQLPFEGSFWDKLNRKREFDAPAPGEIVPGTPDDLNDLCVDLMRREPAARPDEARIRARLRIQSVETQPEPAATDDEMPFVGRREQLKLLRDCYDVISNGGTAVVRVLGRSGTGKSALIEHFFSELNSSTEALILSGRCYERESVPYKAIDTLIDALTSFLLQRSTRGLKLLIPPHISALARIFPVLNRIDMIARSAGDEYLELQELRRRAFTALKEMLARISEIRPLVLHIDDLQWGDNDSAGLLAELLEAPVPSRLMMLLAYRSEYEASSPFLQALERMSRAGDSTIRHEKIPVQPFTIDEAAELARTLLGEANEENRRQAEQIAVESGGNPYFVYELVRHLRGGSGLGEIRALDLDEILWLRARRLPEVSRRLLEVIAVNSRPISLRYAQQAAGATTMPLQLINDLHSQHLVRSTGPGLDDQFETYHDRIRESLLARIPPETRVSHHGALADTLEKSGDSAPELLAAHCQGAGRIEAAGMYYEQAADHAIRALAFDRADDYFQRAQALATSKHRRAAISEKRIHFYTDLARFPEAYEVGYQAVQEFGLKIPPKFHPPSFAWDLITARLMLGRKKIPELIDLPTIRDEDLATGMRLMAAVGKVAYQLRPELCISVMVKLVKLCLRNGNLPDAAIGYVAFGSIFLGGILGRYRTGAEFGKLALDLVEKHDNRKQRAEVLFLNGYFGNSWLKPASEAERLWDRAYSAGLESGDLFHTGCASCATVMSRFMRGVPLTEVWDESDKYLEFLRRANLREPLGALQAVRQAVRCLRGETRGHDSFETDDFDEESFIESLGGYGSRHFAHYYFIVRMQCLYLAGEYEQALAMAEAGEAYQSDSRGMLHSAEQICQHALILAAITGNLGGLKRQSNLRKIGRMHRRLRKWATLCPENFLARERLIAGELSRLTGDSTGALAAFEKAESSAGGYGQLQIAALACQLASRIDELSGRPEESRLRREKAREYYRRWGASALY